MIGVTIESIVDSSKTNVVVVYFIKWSWVIYALPIIKNVKIYKPLRDVTVYDSYKAKYGCVFSKYGLEIYYGINDVYTSSKTSNKFKFISFG